MFVGSRLFCAADPALTDVDRVCKDLNLQPGVLVDRDGGGGTTVVMSKSAFTISTLKKQN